MKRIFLVSLLFPLLVIGVVAYVIYVLVQCGVQLPNPNDI